MSTTTVSTHKTVLFALDESSHAIAALNWVFDYILRDGDKLTVAVVVEKEDIESTTSRVKTLLRSVWQSNNVNCTMSIRVIQGSPSKAGALICKLVDEIQPKPAMLVLGSRGRSNMQGFFVGSVSNYCLANASIPVIVARSEARGRDMAASSCNRSQSPMWV